MSKTQFHKQPVGPADYKERMVGGALVESNNFKGLAGD